MKKLLCMLLAALMVLTMASFAMAEEAASYKIAVMTGTTSQGEEEVRAAERAIATYGEDHIIHDTYPDNFASETETTISKLVSFASDPDVKAIVMCQAVPGAKAGFDKIREMRDDILLIAGVPQEDPDVITAAADLVLYSDEPAQGDSIIETCANWGIEVFVHYSFPRHLAMETIAARKALFEANCEALGIQYVEATAPDPTGDAGVSGAQQFILEDVPLKMEEFAGKKVAFFSTNCAMQEPLQTAILTQPNAYYPQPCCPSPYHAFPAALGLESLQSAAMTPTRSSRSLRSCPSMTLWAATPPGRPRSTWPSSTWAPRMRRPTSTAPWARTTPRRSASSSRLPLRALCWRTTPTPTAPPTTTTTPSCWALLISTTTSSNQPA